MAAYKNATATVLPVHAFAVKVWALRLGKRTDVQITQLEDKLAQGSLEADTTLETLWRQTGIGQQLHWWNINHPYGVVSEDRLGGNQTMRNLPVGACDTLLFIATCCCSSA